MPFTESNGILQPLILANMSELTKSDPAATPNLAPMAIQLSLAFATWIINPAVAIGICTNQKPLDGLLILPGGGSIQIPKVELDIVPLPTSETILTTSIITQSQGLSSTDPAAIPNVRKFAAALSKAVHRFLKDKGKKAVTNSVPILGTPPTAIAAGGEPVLISSSTAILNVTGLTDKGVLSRYIREEITTLISSDLTAANPLKDTSDALAAALTQWFKLAGIGAVTNFLPWTGFPPIVPPATPPAVPTTIGLPKWAVASKQAVGDFI
jgi:hypothetical protein